jgi:Leucine-rich repeat (LRR) protein
MVSTGGPNWNTENFPVQFGLGKTPWLSYSDECSWVSTNNGADGRICDNNNDIFALHLRRAGLSGTIPSEIGLLTKLRFLFAHDSELTGSIPTTIGKLTQLVKMHIARNQIDSTIPSELGQLTDLSLLALANNYFTGTLPSELSNLRNIVTLALQGNNLNGTLPQLSELTQVGEFEKMYDDQ